MVKPDNKPTPEQWLAKLNDKPGDLDAIKRFFIQLVGIGYLVIGVAIPVGMAYMLFSNFYYRAPIQLYNSPDFSGAQLVCLHAAALFVATVSCAIAGYFLDSKRTLSPFTFLAFIGLGVAFWLIFVYILPLIQFQTIRRIGFRKGIP